MEKFFSFKFDRDTKLSFDTFCGHHFFQQQQNMMLLVYLVKMTFI